MASRINPKIRARGIILIFILIGLLQTASASGNDITELKERIFSFDDPKITVRDLAFFLLTHNFDAKPMDGYVGVKLDRTIYKLIPNGNKPGLCDISTAIS
jgi:hypothetical protein